MDDLDILPGFDSGGVDFIYLYLTFNSNRNCAVPVDSIPAYVDIILYIV